MSHQRSPFSKEMTADTLSLQAAWYCQLTALLMVIVSAALLMNFGMPTSIFSSSLWAVIVAFTGLLGTWLSRRGHIDLGIGLVIGILQLAIIVPSIRTSGLGVAFAIVSVPVIFGLSLLMHSQTATILAQLSSIITAVLLLSMDFFKPFDRVSSAGMTGITRVIAGGVILLYVIFIVRQAWVGITVRDRTK